MYVTLHKCLDFDGPMCTHVFKCSPSLSPEIFEQGLNPEISVQPEYQYLQCVPPRPRLNDPMMYCMDENLNNMRENFTAHCNASDGGTVVWLIGGYALVDSDQFSPEAYGVLVEDFESNISLFPCGADFLMGQFEESFNITCLSMVDEVNGCQSNDHLFFHEGCECVCLFV